MLLSVTGYAEPDEMRPMLVIRVMGFYVAFRMTLRANLGTDNDSIAYIVCDLRTNALFVASLLVFEIFRHVAASIGEHLCFVFAMPFSRVLQATPATVGRTAHAGFYAASRAK